MVNNSVKIGSMLSFEKDDFYFLQILKRRKDNPGMERDMIVIDNFYIDSMEQYIKIIPRIIRICEYENARAYFRLNKRNYKKLGQHMLRRVVDVIFSDTPKSLKNVFDSVAGEFHSDIDKKWIIDIDWVDHEDETIIDDVIPLLRQLQLNANREPMLEILETKNGVHIITRPFDLKMFKNIYPEIQAHKDNPTLLFCT